MARKKPRWQRRKKTTTTPDKSLPPNGAQVELEADLSLAALRRRLISILNGFKIKVGLKESASWKPTVFSVEELPEYRIWERLRRRRAYQADVRRLVEKYGECLRKEYPAAFKEFRYPGGKHFQGWLADVTFAGPREPLRLPRRFRVPTGDPNWVYEPDLSPMEKEQLNLWKKHGLPWPVPPEIKYPHPYVLDMLRPRAVSVLGIKWREDRQEEVKNEPVVGSKVRIEIDTRRLSPEVVEEIVERVKMALETIIEKRKLLPFSVTDLPGMIRLGRNTEMALEAARLFSETRDIESIARKYWPQEYQEEQERLRKAGERYESSEAENLSPEDADELLEATYEQSTVLRRAYRLVMRGQQLLEGGEPEFPPNRPRKSSRRRR